MAECCCPAPEATSRPPCAGCGATSAPVETATIKALLMPSALARLHASVFHFCATPQCDTVYFSDDGQVFHAVDVREPVWQKQPSGGRMICYCFGENEADMRHEIETTGQTRAIDRVRGHIADRRCACEVRNPRGACCLGDLTLVVKALGRIGQTV